MNPSNILILPGWQNSGAGHWQSLWENQFDFKRVDQHDWQNPLRGDWIARLEDVVRGTSGPVVLVAHSLGCLLVAAWASHSLHAKRVKAALLVAPGDAEREELRPVLHSWSPIAMQTLPFKSILVASRDDPFCHFERAQTFANAWGSEWVDAGCLGHINADSRLKAWPQGLALLASLTSTNQIQE